MGAVAEPGSPLNPLPPAGGSPPPAVTGGGGSSGGSSSSGGGASAPLIPPSYSQPFFDWQNLATNAASYGAQSMPGAAAYQQSLFTPGLNTNENMFMENEAARQSRALGPAMARMQAQFAGTGMHSGMNNSFRELGEGMGLNLGNQALQLSLARQQQATGQLDRILGSPVGQAQSAANAGTGLASLGQGLYNSAMQGPLGFLDQSPIMAPTIIPGASGGGGGGKK